MKEGPLNCQIAPTPKGPGPKNGPNAGSNSSDRAGNEANSGASGMARSHDLNHGSPSEGNGFQQGVACHDDRPCVATRSVLRLGITGGIGSGKTTVARLLGVMGIAVYIADLEARRLMLTDRTIRQQLTNLIGPEAYTADGRLCKERIASYLFASPDHAARVNAIVHPCVRNDFRLWTQRQVPTSLPTPCPRQGVHLPRLDTIHTARVLPVAMESAIIIEAGFRQEVDRLIVVTAPLETRIARAMQRDHAPREAVERRIDAQMPEHERCDQADFIIHNDGIHPLIPQVVDLVQRLHLG